MNTTKPLRLCFPLILAGIFCLCVLSCLSLAETPERPTLVKANLLAELQTAGLRGDRTRIPQMLEELRSDNYYEQVTALTALARLGASEALPDIDALIAKYSADWRAFGQAYRARLVVEAAQPAAGNTKQALQTQPVLQFQSVPQSSALAKMRTLLSELHLNADKIKTDIAAYHPQNDPVDAPRPPLAVFALRQLADIAYLNGYKPDKTAEDINALDFSQVPDAALKMRLAPLSRQQRIAWLLDDITLYKQEYVKAGLYEQQLLLNEGPAAGQAIAARLQDMNAHPNKYAPGAKTQDRFSPFHLDRDALTRILENLGDNSQAPLISRLLNEQVKRDKLQPLTPKQASFISQLDQHKRPIIYGY